MTAIVSVVMAAYNAERSIETSIRSALDQSFADLEVIVVDDGSTDDSAAIAAAINDPRLKVVKQANLGQSAALNRGVIESHGTFIKFLDSDDMVNPTHIAFQVEALTGSEDHVASCRWGYFVTDPSDTLVRTEHTNRDYDDPLEWLVDSLSLDEGSMGGWMWLIPRKVWNRTGGWNESLSLNNDFDFSVRLLLASSGVRFAPDAIYSYRKGFAGALTGTRSARAMESAFATTESGCRHLLDRETSPRIRRICADRWQWWLYHFYPEHPTLARLAEREVQRLGGSNKPLEGGRILNALLPLIGWKGIRQLQSRAYRLGWRSVLEWKDRRRLKDYMNAGVAGK